MTFPRVLPGLPAGVLALGIAFGATTTFAQDDVDFVKDIKPIFERRCYECHGARKQDGELRLDRRAAVFGPEEDLWVVVPGKLTESYLYERITLPTDDPDFMPAKGDPLSKEQIALIAQWIEKGADWPESADAPMEAEPAVPTLEIPERDEAERKAEAAALERLAERGALAMRVAANTEGIEVNFSLLGADVNDADLALLEGLEKALVWLNLSRTSVTDAGLARLVGFHQLRRLHLANTGVSDAGVEHLGGLTQLQYLNLYGTKVGDAGLAHLKGLKALRKLFLWQSAVTGEGVAALTTALPELHADTGDYAQKLEVVEEPEGKPINATCPLTGKPIDPQFTYTYQDQVIGFCCANCLESFKKDPKAHIGKVKEFQSVATAAPAEKKLLNTKCLVMPDKDVNPKCTVEVEGSLIGFCCGNCLKAYQADPAKYADAVAKLLPKKDEPAPVAIDPKPVNETCPISNRPVKPEYTAVHGGKTYAFCCPHCVEAFRKDPERYLSK